MRILKLLVRLYIDAKCSLQITSGVPSLSQLHPSSCPLQAHPSGVTRLLFPPRASLHPPFQPFFSFPFFLINFCFIFYFCMWEDVPRHTARVRGPFVEAGSLLSPCEPWGLDSRHQTWPQVPLPAEPFYRPTFLFPGRHYSPSLARLLASLLLPAS